MPYVVEPTRSARKTIRGLRGKVKTEYERAEERLTHEGCKAAGYRMRAEEAFGSDARVCCLRFYADWRMHLLFGDDDTIVVFFLGRKSDEVHKRAARIVPELSEIGRPREDQPPCCDELDDAPVAQDLVDLVRSL